MVGPKNSFISDRDAKAKEISRQQRLLRKMYAQGTNRVKMRDGSKMLISKALVLAAKGIILLPLIKTCLVAERPCKKLKVEETSELQLCKQYKKDLATILDLTGYRPNELTASKLMPKFKVKGFLEWVAKQT